MRRATRIRLLGLWLSTAVASIATNSCTVVGACIGYSVGTKTVDEAPGEALPLEEGAQVDIARRSGWHVHGRYVGLSGPTPDDPELYLRVQSDGGFTQVPVSDVDRIGVEVHGMGVLYGALIGLAVDTAIVVALVESRALEPHINYGGGGGF